MLIGVVTLLEPIRNLILREPRGSLVFHKPIVIPECHMEVLLKVLSISTHGLQVVQWDVWG